MSKIKINEIESASTDLTVIPTGTDGTLEVANEDQQSSIQLNDSLDVNKVKVKGPVNTASQDYTLVLPATDVTADKYLKVESLQGSGSTAIAHLGYHTFTPADENNLVGSSFTSGAVPAARYNLSGTAGGGLKLVQKQTITAAQENTIQKIVFTGFEDNTMYKLYVENCETSSPTTVTPQGGPTMRFLDNTYNGDGNTGYLGNIFQFNHLYYDLGGGNYAQEDTGAYYYHWDTAYSDHLNYVMEFYNASPTNNNEAKVFGMFRGISAVNSYNHLRSYWSFKKFSTGSSQFVRFHGIEFSVQYPTLGSNTYYWAVGTTFSLYKYDAT